MADTIVRTEPPEAKPGPGPSPAVILLGRIIPGGEDGTTLTVSGSRLMSNIVRGLVARSPVLSELLGEDFEFDSGLELLDREVVRTQFDRVGALPLLDTVERWARRSSTEDADVERLGALVEGVELPSAEPEGGAADADSSDGPGFDVAATTDLNDEAAQQAQGTQETMVRESLEQGLSLTKTFSKLALGTPEEFTKQAAVLKAVLARAPERTREGLLSAVQEVRETAMARIDALTDEAAEQIDEAREALASIGSFLENSGPGVVKELTVIHFNDPEKALAQAKPGGAIARLLSEQVPSFDLVVVNTLKSLVSLDNLANNELGSSPNAHGVIWATVDATDLEEAIELAKGSPARLSVADGHIAVWLGAGTHRASGTTIGVAAAIAGLKRRLDTRVDPSRYEYGLFEATAGRRGGDIRAIRGLDNVSLSKICADDAEVLSEAGLNTMRWDQGLLYSRSAYSRSSAEVYRFVDSTRGIDACVGAARDYFSRDVLWASGSSAMKARSIKKFEEAVLRPLLHEGVFDAELIDESDKPETLQIRFKTRFAPMIERVVIISGPEVLEDEG